MTNREKLEQIFPDGICPFSHNWLESEYKPSIQPKPKTGHWILTDDDFVYCSECEDSYYPRPIDASWYYCPHCGCIMVEPQESEG